MLVAMLVPELAEYAPYLLRAHSLMEIDINRNNYVIKTVTGLRKVKYRAQ